MIVWLDHLAFGNGHGMKSPFSNNMFYWLSGDMYTFFAGYGAQFTSWRWFFPDENEKVVLEIGDSTYTLVPFSSRRNWLRVIVTWRCLEMPDNFLEQGFFLTKLKNELDII